MPPRQPRIPEPQRADPVGQLHQVDRDAARKNVHAVLIAAVICVLAYFFGQPAAAAELTPTAAAPYRADLVRAAHSQWGLDAPVAVLAAQVHQESGWNPRAVSGVGARGLAQFMPGTATWWCERQGVPASACTPSNPSWALRALVGYDKYLWDRIPEQASADRMWAALRAYNGGLGHWQAEASLAADKSRKGVDSACGRARRARQFCAENLGYPHRIMVQLQPRYVAWGPGLWVAGE